jgi:drug/metabolite transporter (DMT)-like permease
MPPVVLVLLAVAAVLHAVWNVLVKTSEDPLAVSARGVTWGLAVATPFAAAAWWLSGTPALPPEGWALAGGSAAVELCYFVFLSAAYRRGDLSTVYPIARGTAPLLAVAIGLAVLGERLEPGAAVGVGLLLAGIWLARSPARSGPAVGFAMLTGVAIATYTAIDRLGVQVAPPWLYGWTLWLFTAALLQAWIGVRGVLRPRGSSSPSAADAARVDRAPTAPGWRRDLVVGSAMVVTWFFVLVALSLAPLAAVAPLRESAIVLTTGWGVFRLGERRGATLRIIGALAIGGGVVLLALA